MINPCLLFIKGKNEGGSIPFKKLVRKRVYDRISAMKTFINAAFAAGVLAALIAGLGKAALLPEEINEYENRYMEQFAPLTVESYLDGSFQDQAEKALGDQLPWALDAKKSYNEQVSELTSGIFEGLTAEYRAQVRKEEEERLEEERKAEEERLAAEEKALKEAKDAEERAALEAKREAERLAREAEIKLQNELSMGIYRGVRNPVKLETAERYFTLPSGRLVLKDHLMYANRFLDGEKSKLDSYIKGANSLIARHPEISFYTYYIEKETDVNFVSGERSGIFEYLHEGIDLPDEQKRGFLIDRFSDFDAWFFKTDHHWSGTGSYRGYTQVLDMLLPGETPLKPVEYVEIGKLSGSKATGSDTERYTETVGVWTYDLKPVTITLNGSRSSEYGRQLAYVKRIKDGGSMLQEAKYGAVYGPDSGEAIFENPDSDNGSVLMLGESYDNALLLLLSQHFTTLYSVDLRNYKNQTGKTFNFDKYVAERSIDRVLLIGNLDYYVLPAFIPR